MAGIQPGPFLAFTVAVLLAALSFAFFSRLGRSRSFSRPIPPGPWGLPLLGSLPFLDPELHTYFTALASKHGPVFSLRLGGKLGVVVSSRDAAREVFRDQDAVFANHDVPVAGSVSIYGGRHDVVWSPNGPTWRMLRKVCVRELLCGSALASFYGLRRREVRAMVSRVAARASEAGAVDIGKETFMTVMNTMTSMLWGGGGDADEGSDVLGEEFKDVITRVVALIGQPNLSDFFPCLRYFDLQGIEKKTRMYSERLDGIFQQIISAKEKRHHDGSGGGGADFLDAMLRIERSGGDGKTAFTRTNTKALLMNMVLGGTDTVSSTMEFALGNMMKRPETISAVHAELDEAVGRDRMLEEPEALNLRYLSAAIKESLRLHPTAPLLVPRCPSTDSIVGGYTVPAGSRVFVNAWAIHRDPEIWEDPLAYKPERFLDVSDAFCSSLYDFSGNDLRYIPFGSGRRICPGTVVAERTLLYTLGTLLHAFDWRLPDGETEVDLREKFGIVLQKKKPLLLVPKQRLSNPELYAQ